ncbi:hypothetical protein ACQ4PT_001214 [Festuca glaucescens]
MSLTTDVFTYNRPGYYRVYYIVTKSQDVAAALETPHPVVLMFWASWNEPCKVMMRPFWDLAVAKRKEAVFLRVDVDKFRDIVEQYQVEALPTFLLIKGGVVKGRVVGAKVDELNTAIKARI